MSSIGPGGGFRLTPRQRSHPAHNNSKYQEDDRLQLSLKTVIGTTTSSSNAFDSDPTRHAFVYCAGPATIVSYVDEDLNITQRLYRARQNALPINATSSFYNPQTPPATPSKRRHGSPFKENGFANGTGATFENAPESPSTSKIQNRVREVTCVSFSRQGRLLAVGETGYNPRVLLFSTVQDAPTDVPLSVLTDHSFGVQSVAFSEDSQWLASLGNAYDGFLLLYTVNHKAGTARLHSSNKCSNVAGICWMGNALVSYGTRHVKVWRVEAIAPTKILSSSAVPSASPGPRIFSGRNCILGNLIDATFTAGVAIARTRACLATNNGEICLLEDGAQTQKLERKSALPYGVASMHCDIEEGCLWIGGDAGQVERLALTEMKNMGSGLSHSDTASQPCPQIIAIGSVRNHLVTVDSDRVVELKNLSMEDGVVNAYNASKKLPAHESAVLGVCSVRHWTNDDKLDFVTYSARGTALYWTFDGAYCGSLEIAIHQPMNTPEFDTNELKTLTASDSDEVFYAGDRMGLLYAIDRAGTLLASIQAHSGDINGVTAVTTSRSKLICTCGRDRTLQLFERSENGMSLTQTLDDHAASVTDAIFLDQASTLISISSDRTVLVRKAAYGDRQSVAYIPMRVITLKASPVSFATVPSDPNIVLVSTMDRQIHKLDINTGRSQQIFKATDPLNNDSVLINYMQIAKINTFDDRLPVILAVSSTDKSIRLHDYDSGSLVTREHGQAAVSAASLIQGERNGEQVTNIVSCGLDGTVIVYNVSCQPFPQRYNTPHGSPLRAESPLKQTATPIQQPPRKTLTKAEVAEFQKALAESESDTVGSLRSPSPSRIHKRPSRYSLNGTSPRIGATGSSSTNYMTSTTSSQRKLSQDHLPTPTSPNNTLKTSKAKPRPSLDHRRRSKSAANLNDLNASAEKLCEGLRIFRRRIESSLADKIKTKTLRDLRHELELTVQTTNEEGGFGKRAAQQQQVLDSSPMPSGNAMDAYLARMIDERLALTTRSKEGDTSSKGGVEAEAQAGAGAVATKKSSGEGSS